MDRFHRHFGASDIALFIKTTEAVVGFERPPKRNQGHDEECRAASAAPNAARRRTLQSAQTRAVVEDHRQKRREEKHLIRKA